MKKIIIIAIIFSIFHFASGQNKEVDQSLEVGSLPGQLSVNSSGAAVYSIPISLPPARGGITPGLAFIYNSQSGNGIMGKGWSMSGFSSIRRVNPTLYHDGKVQQLNFGPEDGFLLDGQRLIKVETHANGIIEYRTEADRAARVQYHPNGGENDLDYWEVNYKNGLTKLYGYNKGSRQYNSNAYSGADFPLVWHVSNTHQPGYKSTGKAPGKVFYQVNYTYDQNTYYGECYPKRIEYNSISSDAALDDPNYSINFSYETINTEDQRVEYYQFNDAQEERDFRVKSSRRLLKVEVKHSEKESYPLSVYTLSYASGQSCTREKFLESIELQRRGPDTKLTAINTTDFDWDFYSTELHVNTLGSHNVVPIEALEAVILTAIDINGDGKDEIAENRYYANGYGFEYKIIIRGLEQDIEVESNSSNKVRSLQRGDFNGDGRDELIIGYDAKFKIYSFDKNSAGWFANSNPYVNSEDYGPHGKLFAADINGDGLTDCITTQNTNRNCAVYIGSGNLDDLFINDNGNAYRFAYYNSMVRTVLDFTGDGNVEILVTGVTANTLNIDIYDFEWDFSNNTGGFKPPISFDLSRRAHFLYNDFNGDGKADVLRITGDEDYYFYPSYGSGIKRAPVIAYSQTGLNNQTPYAVDMNNDGRTDLVTIQKTGNKVRLRVGYAKPDGVHFEFTDIGEYQMLNDTYYNNMNIAAKAFADLTGDGVINPVFELSFQDVSKEGSAIPQDYKLVLKSLENHEYAEPDVIGKITNAYGVSTHINYQAFSSSYADDIQAYPLGKYKSKEAIVKETYTGYKNGIKLGHMRYAFFKPVVHKQGNGFLGFLQQEVINQQNWTKTSKTTEIYTSNNLYYYPYVKETSTILVPAKAGPGISPVADSDICISKTQNKLEIKNTIATNNKIYYPVITQSLSQSWDANGAVMGTQKTIVNKADIDLFGNVKKSTRLSGESILAISAPESAYSFKTEQIMNYNYDVNHWIVNLPGNKRLVKKDLQTGETDMHMDFYTYHPESNMGWPFLKTVYSIPNGNAALAISMHYEYDKYGNKTKESISANGQTSRETNYQYSTAYDGRFLTATWKTLKGVAYKTAYTYYEEFGLLKSEIENPDYPANRRETKYFYDALGRNNLSLLPGNLYQKKLIAFQGDEKPIPGKGDALYTVQSYMYTAGNENNQASWMNHQLTFFNKYEQDIASVVWDQNNRGLVSSREYNEKALLQKEENPHFISETNFLSTTYEYDQLGRIEKVNAPGASVKTEYNGLENTVTNRTTNVSKTSSKNARGQLLRVSGETGNITYTYYSSGQLKSTNVNGIISSNQYDDANRLVQQLDPDMGNYTYTYNKYGEITGTTDDKGSITTISYDDLGRMQEKQIQDKLPETIKYTYQDNPAKHGLGLLEKEEVEGLNSYSYIYDAQNRLSRKVERIDGKDYQHQYYYNNTTQQLEVVVFPSQYAIRYHYRNNGVLHRVTEAKSKHVLWEAVDNNGMGQLTEYKLGNGLTTRKAYNEYGNLTSIETSNNTQHLAYSFDVASGNLLLRQDFRNGHVNREQFTYDEKQTNNRLLSWRVNGNPAYHMTYEDNGNIFTKSDVTTPGDPLSVYRYGGDAGEHALSHVNKPQQQYLAEASNAQSVIYNAHNKVAKLTTNIVSKHGSKYSYTLDFEYGANQARKASRFYRNKLLLRTKYYIGGDYEEEKTLDGNIRKLHYLSGADGVFAIYVLNTMKSDSLYYIHKDYLGSMETITDEKGVVLEKLSFDPWGRRRNPVNWTYNTSGLSPGIFDRGYTMHEHLDVFGLINMNGRMYDPRIGRMLSPDPFIQEPENLQNYNRYSYALNNPLKYTDPTGYHHGSVFKPGDWDAGIGGAGGNGLLYLNTMFTNDHRFDFSGVNAAADAALGVVDYSAYSYRGGRYYNNSGEAVSYGEVFTNFIEPNAAELPRNTDLRSLEMRNGGYQYYTIDPTNSPIWSSSESELNLHFVSLSKGTGQTGKDSYTEKSFSDSGFKGSWTTLEGVGAAGGYFYSLGGKTVKDNNGRWYIYASASAWAPGAEQKSNSIQYNSTISIYRNEELVSKGNLQLGSSNSLMVGPSDFTYIGSGYMPLPSVGNNVSVQIRISYTAYQWWNGSGSPVSPYIYTIRF